MNRLYLLLCLTVITVCASGCATRRTSANCPAAGPTVVEVSAAPDPTQSGWTVVMPGDTL
jgi:hypothetical protein